MLLNIIDFIRNAFNLENYLFQEVESMVYKKGDYTLYCKEVRFKAGKKPGKPRTIYYFAKTKPTSGTPCDMPNGYEVGVNDRTGMPYLKYSKGKQSTWKKRWNERHSKNKL